MKMYGVYDKLNGVITKSDFDKGFYYDKDYVELLETTSTRDYRNLKFKVESESINLYYKVKIAIDLKEKIIVEMGCTCPQYKQTGCCKHIAASAINYYEELFEEDYDDVQLKTSKDIISAFYKPRVNKIRKKLSLEVNITVEDSWFYGDYYKIWFKIGEDKLYTLKSKFLKFLDAYKNDYAYTMTSKFTYWNGNYYFSDIDKKILDFCVKNKDRAGADGMVLDTENVTKFLPLLNNKKFNTSDDLGNKKFNGIKEENPFKINLKKENKQYLLEIGNMDDFKYYAPGYVYSENTLYKISSSLAKLYSMMKNASLKTLVFEKNELEQFSNGILQVIKDDVNIDESAKEIVITNEPLVKLYFDFYNNAIECNVKLDYGNSEINIFEYTPNILRNQNYETKIYDNLSDYNFKANESKKTFILDDIDDIGDFLENGINNLSEIYNVFTSQKIKNTSVTSKTKTQVNFNIGQDNIMSYDFSLDGIDKEELSKVLDSMQAKKRYYKLKSGNILNLEDNEDLQKFGNLVEDMELSDKDIDAGGGTVPKYRAIYFDSLKNNRYNGAISTNNLFDELINKFNSYKKNKINLSKKELSILRDYQVSGIQWLYNIYKCGFGGILADEMGLGKSIQLIYLIKLIIKENPNAKILIASPTSLVYNWKKEFDKFGSEIKYKVFAENKEKRLQGLEDTSDVNVLITTYGLVRNDEKVYKNMNFELIAIDEAQNIKNPYAQITKSIKNLNANVKIALTGTPLENSVIELWSIFDFIMPGYLANIKKFQSLYNIKDTDEESIKKLDTLNMQITYFILRRKKKDVVKDLPDKIENNIYVDLGAVQKGLYIAEVQKTREEMDDLMATEGFAKARFKILQLLTKLRQICIDPSIAFSNYKGGRAKIEELIKIVKTVKENGHKMLIFTTYKTALNIVEKELKKAGISSYHIDGSVPSKKRMELVESFNNDDTDVFIITLKAGGTGLNLTSATVVIHLDLWWNPQVENQATDRAHRIGQKETVEVIRLIAKGTIEERILELQTKKRKLADALIEGDMKSKNQFSNLTEKDIQMLLSIDNEEDVLV